MPLKLQHGMLAQLREEWEKRRKRLMRRTDMEGVLHLDAAWRVPTSNGDCFIVVDYLAMRLVYAGHMLLNAAGKLNPGTVYGVGRNWDEAMARAESCAVRARNRRK